jgi:hypothetical protein
LGISLKIGGRDLGGFRFRDLGDSQKLEKGKK